MKPRHPTSRTLKPFEHHVVRSLKLVESGGSEPDIEIGEVCFVSLVGNGLYLSPSWAKNTVFNGDAVEGVDFVFV